MKKYSTHSKRAQNAPNRFEAAFTLIEVMLVVVIIGVMAAVIVPRAWRANIDTKYATLRQTCTQLAGYANDWAERQLETRSPTANSATLVDYMNTLGGSGTAIYIALDGDSNWNNNPTHDFLDVNGTDPTATVQDLVPQGSPLRNPFNGLEVFRSGNAGDTIQGAIGCAYDNDDGYNYYALIFRSGYTSY